MSKKLPIIFIILFLLITAGVALFYWDTPAQGEIHEIILTENGFTPSEITIKPGDLIKFSTTTNQPYWPASDLHPTHGIYPEFDPLEPVDPNRSWTFQFLKTGRWKFHDHLKPAAKGIVTVN